jgi:hypothetical protein
MTVSKLLNQKIGTGNGPSNGNGNTLPTKPKSSSPFIPSQTANKRQVFPVPQTVSL